MYNIYKLFIVRKETQWPIKNDKMPSLKNFVWEMQSKTIMMYYFINIILAQILKCDNSKGLVRMLKISTFHILLMGKGLGTKPEEKISCIKFLLKCLTAWRTKEGIKGYCSKVLMSYMKGYSIWRQLWYVRDAYFNHRATTDKMKQGCIIKEPKWS